MSYFVWRLFRVLRYKCMYHDKNINFDNCFYFRPSKLFSTNCLSFDKNIIFRPKIWFPANFVIVCKRLNCLTSDVRVFFLKSTVREYGLYFSGLCSVSIVNPKKRSVFSNFRANLWIVFGTLGKLPQSGDKKMYLSKGDVYSVSIEGLEEITTKFIWWIKEKK